MARCELIVVAARGTNREYTSELSEPSVTVEPNCHALCPYPGDVSNRRFETYPANVVKNSSSIWGSHSHDSRSYGRLDHPIRLGFTQIPTDNRRVPEECASHMLPRVCILWHDAG
eukprot:scaffold184539_cov27-Tisochrysis_lutea.AAC.6